MHPLLANKIIMVNSGDVSPGTMHILNTYKKRILSMALASSTEMALSTNDN